MAGAHGAGVLLVNLGTPEEPTPGAVRKFLREFLWDPRVVEIPRLPWWLILNLFVLPLRPGKVAQKYAKIWMPEGSPLRVYTLRQAQILKGALGERMDTFVPVAVGMRYGKPSIAEGLAQLREAGVARVVVLPLFPQYAGSTTASVEDAVGKALRKWKPAPALHVVRDFHDHPAYVKAIAKAVNDYWFKHGRPDKLVMSFHGLPKRSVERGDPYRDQCMASARLVATELGWNDARTVVTFQSRFGAQEWLQPYTAATLEQLGRDGVGRVDVVCPGFGADCLETLEEIAIEGRRTFLQAGGKEFNYIPSTNDAKPWIVALTILAMEGMQGRAPARAGERKENA
jgi:ferrochelatase